MTAQLHLLAGLHIWYKSSLWFHLVQVLCLSTPLASFYLTRRLICSCKRKTISSFRQPCKTYNILRISFLKTYILDMSITVYPPHIDIPSLHRIRFASLFRSLMVIKYLRRKCVTYDFLSNIIFVCTPLYIPESISS